MADVWPLGSTSHCVPGLTELEGLAARSSASPLPICGGSPSPPTSEVAVIVAHPAAEPVQAALRADEQQVAISWPAQRIPQRRRRPGDGSGRRRSPTMSEPKRSQRGTDVMHRSAERSLHRLCRRVSDDDRDLAGRWAGRTATDRQRRCRPSRRLLGQLGEAAHAMRGRAERPASAIGIGLDQQARRRRRSGPGRRREQGGPRRSAGCRRRSRPCQPSTRASRTEIAAATSVDKVSGPWTVTMVDTPSCDSSTDQTTASDSSSWLAGLPMRRPMR